MSKRDWKLFIYDILECIKKIEKYVTNLSYDDFFGDEKTKDAVVRNLEIIGEAAKHIPEEIKRKYPEIPWQQIMGLKIRLVHAYFIVDYYVVWNIITKELPDLKTKIVEILKRERLR